MNIIKTSVLALSLVAAGQAVAVTELNKSITSVGVQGTLSYISVSPPPSGCLYNLIYIADISTASGRSLYATLMMAMSSGKNLYRVDFYPSPSQPARCDLNLIEIRP